MGLRLNSTNGTMLTTYAVLDQVQRDENGIEDPTNFGTYKYQPCANLAAYAVSPKAPGESDDERDDRRGLPAKNCATTPSYSYGSSMLTSVLQPTRTICGVWDVI